jgi:hypothetical protein
MPSRDPNVPRATIKEARAGCDTHPNSGQMRRCTTITIDGAQHAGPFTLLRQFADHKDERLRSLRIERCAACGDLVVREVKPEQGTRISTP